MDFSLTKPTVDDAPEVAELINHFGDKGLLLKRAVNGVYEQLRDFVICRHRGRILGCAALHVVWGGLGELRSLAVAEDARGHGLGRALTESCLRDARELRIDQVFVLTYETAFFARFGFREHPKENLPQKVWKDCVHCPKFPNCDETAMLLDLTTNS